MTATPTSGPSPAQPDEASYLVTGALGCIGAWTTRLLLQSGAKVVALDAGDQDHRLRAALLDVPTDGLSRVTGDVTDQDQITGLLKEHSIDAVIHLAALQVPSCQANPVLGARVNVVGQLVMLEAARISAAGSSHGRRPLVYASSVGAYGASDGGEPVMTTAPGTFYGVYKRAGEQAANLYFSEFETPSTGIRPHTVYGPGRDFGLSSQPTAAVLAASESRPHHLPYGGMMQMQYVEDVAQSFINASRSDFQGATVVDLVGHSVPMQEIVDAITGAVPESAGTITFDDVPFPFPADLKAGDAPFTRAPDRTLEEGMRDTVAHARRLRDQ